MQTYAKIQWRTISTISDDIKLEFGAGKKGVNGWITVDKFGGDICWDLTKKIPMKDNSVREIYHSHLLEHLNFKQILYFLGECKRILVPGGVMKICIPNSREYINSYIGSRIFKKDNEMYENAITNTGSYIDQVNYIAYMDGLHKYMFDEDNILNILEMTGFTSFGLRDFDEMIDSIIRRAESIHVIAIK